MQEPVAPFHVSTLFLPVGLVPHAGQFLPVRQPHGETKLLRLGGCDVEKCRSASQDLPALSGFHHFKYNALTKIAAHLLLNGHLGDSPDLLRQLFMAVNMQFPLVFSPVYLLSDHADQPDHSQDVIHMLMSHKQIVDVFHPDPHILQDLQDPVAASGIHQEMGRPLRGLFGQQETGVVVIGYIGVASSKHGQSHKAFSFLRFLRYWIFPGFASGQ